MSMPHDAAVLQTSQNGNFRDVYDADLTAPAAFKETGLVLSPPQCSALAATLVAELVTPAEPVALTPYQRFIALSRYARFLPEAARRESWEETVARYCNFMAKRNPLFPTQRMYDAIVHMRVMPSMRALMTAGQALDKDNVAGYNCFSGETEFVTAEGIKRFSDFRNGDVIEVLGKNTFVPATVRSFGVKKLHKLIIKKGKYEKEIYTTLDHRWLTVEANGTGARSVEKTTGELQPGDVLKQAPNRLAARERATSCNVGVMHGIVFGDGTNQGDCKITLCGDKIALARHFTAGIRHPTFKEDKISKQYISGLPWNWKTLPPLDANSQYLRGFITGWFAADGTIGPSGSNIRVHNRDRQVLDWLRSACAKLGIFARDIEGGARENPFGGAPTTLYSLEFFGERLVPEFFLFAKHRKRFNRRILDNKFKWKVVSVEETDRREKVWCVQEPQDEVFTLANGVQTRNCAYMAVDDQRAFDEAMYILMCGCGLGFSVERQYIKCLPEVSEQFHKSDTVIHVADSRIGWAQSLRELISLLYAGHIPSWNLDKLRAAGAPLKTFGGRSSGPAPLNELFKFAVTIFKNAAGRRLTSVECHDLMCKIGDVVVSGGVRRSALISLSNLSDRRMASAKSGQWWETDPHRQLANNSVAYTEKPEIGQFMQEWITLYESKAGERGIFNRLGARKKVRSLGFRRNSEYEFGTNPCVTGDTMIATVHSGPRSFAELAEAGKDVLVYAWHPKTKLPVVRWMRRPHRTQRDAKLLEVVFDSGLRVKLTPDHFLYTFRGEKVKAKNLRIGQSVRAFSMSKHRDGQLRVHAWDKDTDSACHQWVHRMVWENANGIIDDDKIIHRKDNNPNNNRLRNLEQLTPEEHNQEHYENRLANGFTREGVVVSKKTKRRMKASWTDERRQLYSETMRDYVTNHKVVEIRKAKREDVYNGCVDDAHTYIIVDPVPVAGIMSGIVSANCGEIILRPNQFCNLTEVVIREDDTTDSLREKVELASILGTFQSTFTDFRYLRSAWRKNVEEERLLGVSLTGIMDNQMTSGLLGYGPLGKLLDELCAHSVATNAHWAELIGIPASAAITTVKPSGTASQLVDSSSGIGGRFSRHYVRTVRNDKKDPLSGFLLDQGVPVETDVLKDANWVFSFPMRAPAHSRLADEMTAVQQLEHYLVYAKHWAEHSISITVYVRPNEWLDVAAWVYKNFDDINGLTFLPYSDHSYKQAPYQAISDLEYNTLVAAFPAVDFSQYLVNEHSDNTLGAKQLACAGGVCEI